MRRQFGDLEIVGTDGSREVLRRDDIIESLVMRWQVNGFDCPGAYACLEEQDTPTLTRWLLEAVLGGTCPMERERPAAAVRVLPDNIQN